MASEQQFFDRHFRHLDPELAASFTPAQRHAIWVMFGAAADRDHLVELRRSVRVFRRQFYVAFFVGRERRSQARLEAEGLVSRGLNAVLNVLGAVILAIPAAIALYVAAGLLVDTGSSATGETGLLRAALEQLSVLLSGK